MIADAAIPLVVFALASLATFGLQPPLRRISPRDDVPATERLGLSLILAVVLLGCADAFLSFAIGSFATAFVLPLCAVALVFARPRQVQVQPTPGFARGGPERVEGLNVIACAVGAVALFVVGREIFFFERLTRVGLLYADLPWHIGRVAQQAFLSTPGFVPLSPLAFPGPLPFQAIVADSLAAATFRLLPFPIHAFHYAQALFCWAIVLWTAVALVAGPGVWRSLVVLAAALVAVPAFLYGPAEVAPMFYIFFHANPNSLIAWPIGVALSMHVYRSLRRSSPPWWPALLLIPPASLLFKPNVAVSFGWLEAAGFLIWFWRARLRDVMPWAALGGGLWIAVVIVSHAIGTWPVSAGVHPSLHNFTHYAGVVFGAQSKSRWLIRWAIDAAGAVAVALAAGRTARRHELPVTLIALASAAIYVGLGWWLVAPTGPSEGEPMHVNFELIMWLLTTLLVAALVGDEGARPRGWGVRAAVSAAVVIAGVVFAWTAEIPPGPGNSLRPSLAFTSAVEGRMREAASRAVPDGTCFAYGRRFAIDAGGSLDPDATIAATGCPVINGQRWRGHLGDNRPDQLRDRPAVDVIAGPPFTLVNIR